MIDRTAISIGPGMVQWDGITLHSEGDITMSINPDLFEVATSGHGRLDRRRQDIQIEVGLTPKMWDELAKLFPYATHQVGQSIYGATDKPLTIKPRNGPGWVVANAAITTMPPITLSANQAILGAMTFTGIIANNSDPGDIESYIDSENDPAPLTGFDLTKAPNGPYTASWGSVIEDFHSEAGFAISFDMSTEDVSVDGAGTVDKLLTALDATCTVIPVGVSAQEIIDILGDETGIGQAPPKNDLVIAGARPGMPLVTLKNCIARQSQGRTGATVKRIGEVQFESVRTQAAGLLEALWTFAAVPEPD